MTCVLMKKKKKKEIQDMLRKIGSDSGIKTNCCNKISKIVRRLLFAFYTDSSVIVFHWSFYFAGVRSILCMSDNHTKVIFFAFQKLLSFKKLPSRVSSEQKCLILIGSRCWFVNNYNRIGQMSLNGFVFGNKRVRCLNCRSVWSVSKELKKEKITSYESH